MVVALGMVAVIGLGATLAYMSSTTAKKTNTFTVGKVDATLVEKTDGGKDWDDATDGKNMYPGQSVVKEPQLSIVANSADAYAYIKVEGADALVTQGFIITSGITMNEIKGTTVSALSKDWIKVTTEQGLDGLYRYQGAKATQGIVKKAAKDTELTNPIFDLVTYGDEQEGGTVALESNYITVSGYAVQAEGVDVKDADARAIALSK